MSNARAYTAQIQYAQNYRIYKDEVKKYTENPVNKELHEEILREALTRMNHAKAIILLAQYEENSAHA